MMHPGELTSERVKKAQEAYRVAMTEPLTLENLQRLELKDGDILVVRVPSFISQQAEANIRESLVLATGDKHQVIVLAGGMELAVIAKG